MLTMIQDFTTDSQQIENEDELISFLKRRVDESNRFILWHDSELPNLRVYVKDDISAAYFTSRDNEMFASKGDELREDWVPFRDDSSREYHEIIQLAGASIISWRDSLNVLLEFARTGTISELTAWEHL